MSDNAPVPSTKEFNSLKRFWAADIIVLVCFLSTAIFGLYLFRADLLQTLDSRGTAPIGIIVIRNNVVQRRYADRVIWERLFVNSSVYSGDLIRAADLSAATIFVDDIQIALEENTLIRLQHSPEEWAALEVELRGGNLSVAAGSGERADSRSGVVLNLMGKQVHVESGAKLNAELGDEGIVVKVSEGTAVFVEEGQKKEITEGMMIAQDANGNERKIPAAFVTSFGQNERYLKSTPQPLGVDFAWKSINIEEGKIIRLETAADRNFTKDHRVIPGPDNKARAFLDVGVWFWRLSLDGDVLNTGRLAVADGSGPELLSPVKDSTFRYFSALPQIRFQWSQKSGAAHYIIEISQTADFKEPVISRQASSTSFIQSGLEPGTWYWRVLPVFSSIYKGSAIHSTTGTFKIEKTEDPKTPAIEIPKAALEVKAVTGSYYIVRSGDTLGRIAGRVYGDPYKWPTISEANNLANPDLIYIDQSLFIP